MNKEWMKMTYFTLYASLKQQTQRFCLFVFQKGRLVSLHFLSPAVSARRMLSQFLSSSKAAAPPAAPHRVALGILF